jgi:hypothetical protein
MKKLMMILLLTAFLLPGLCALSGCDYGGMVLTAQDRNQRLARDFDMDNRQLIEDWDYLWLIDEPSQLTIWYVPDYE